MNFGVLGGVNSADMCADFQNQACCIGGDFVDITDQCSHIAVPYSAATASQRTNGRLDGARPPHLAMVKFIAGGMGLARRRVAKEEVESRNPGASGATCTESKTPPEVLREFSEKN